ncbi:MAG: serine/threonine-protein kinase [Myxococcota bacterium]
MVIGNYRLLGRIGSGGMGAVYLGEHMMLGRTVAVKILHDNYAKKPEAAQRFLQEARTSSQLRHPNIIDVTDCGQADDGRLYFVMELCEGRQLAEVLAKGPISLFRALGILSQVTRALEAAHQHGVVHRDLKPENILLERRDGRREIVKVVGEGPARQLVVEKEGKWDFVKVIDFGIAKFRELAEDRDVILGTPAYMSPEQIRGDEVDGRADIYAAGVLFFEMLTGRQPFTGDDPRTICEKHLFEPPPLPRLVRPDIAIPEAAECVILRALSKNPARRQQSMDELYEELQTCFSGVFYKRDADMIPGAQEKGITPGWRRPLKAAIG